MNTCKSTVFQAFTLVTTIILGGIIASPAEQLQAAVRSATSNGPLRLGSMTPAQRQAAAQRAAARRLASAVQNTQSNGIQTFSILASPAMPGMLNPGGTPDYFNVPNYTNSPILRKFVNTLPGVGYDNRNDLGQFIPVAVADKTTYPGSDYYQIGVVDYTQSLHSDLPAVKLRGYKDMAPAADGNPHYLGPLIIAQSGRPVRIKFSNLLGIGTAGDLFLPVDTTVMGAGMGPNDMPGMPGMKENYTQNRAELHLHGGLTPWISDGTPHQWITPANDPTVNPKGVSFQNVPDMVTGSENPHDGTATYYYTNQQSSRLMFYHDHAYGMTRLDVYAGEAAGYLLTDGVEEALIDSGKIPGAGAGVYRYGIPLIIQDKTFVPDTATLAATDPTWDSAKWGGFGQLWYPHVYMPNQNPADAEGANAFGRWDYGPWFWPPLTAAAGLVHPPIIDPVTGNQVPGLPDVSMTMEAFMDTPIVNGTPYPVLQVERKAYRFRILNAANDRYFNLQLYYVDPANPTEVKMVSATPHPGDPTWPATWPTDGRDGGVPDPTTAGPPMIQIGTEGGLLPTPVVIPAQPIGYNYNRRDIVVLNVSDHALFMGPAERADVIVDFSGVPAGSKIILYNDAPAPVPAFDPRYDYYTGDPDQTSTGGAPTTLAGFGPNTRTIMRFDIAAGTPAPAFDLAALQAVFVSSVSSPGAFAASQPPPIVPQAAYGSAFNTTYTDTFSKIEDTSLTFTPAGSAVPTTVPMEPKAIQELFELNYGRMNATMGVELPFTNFNTQTTIPLGYVDPVTETLTNGGIQIWKVTHNGVDTHAVHFHLFNIQLINRVGWDGAIRPPKPNEIGWKETVLMNPLEDAIVAIQPVAPILPFPIPNSMRPLDPTMPVGDMLTVTNPVDGNPLSIPNAITDFGWEYVWHCHLLDHEEMDMMRPMVLTPSAVPADTTPPTAAAFISPGPGGGNPNDVTVTIGAVDNVGGSGVASITYTISGASNVGPVTVPGSFTSVISAGGVTTITYYATDNAGNQGTPISMPIPTVPGAPTIGAVAAGNAQATVSFTPPVSDGGSAITFYTVTSSPGGITATGTSSPITIIGLTNGTAYTFTVTATNAAGTGPASNPSNSTIPSTLPGAPTAVTAVAGNAQATVSFTPPVSDGGSPITLYTVTSNPGGITATGTASPVIVTGLTLGTPYTFTVTATNANGIGPASSPSPVIVIPATVPGAPTIVSVTPGNGQATVDFLPPSSNGGSPITSYTVTSSPGGITAIGTSSPITVTGLTNGVAYTFTVMATNGVGSSSNPSNSVTPATVPDAPIIQNAVEGNGQATVSFVAPASNGGSPITLYTITSNPGGITATGPAGPITVTGLTNGTAYTFTATATNAIGTSQGSTPSNSVTPSLLTPPGVPTSVTAVNGSGQATVSFAAPVSNGGSPIFLYTVTSSPDGIIAAGTSSPITITGLTNGTAYTFTVTAMNVIGTGPASGPSNSVTPALLAVPGAPTIGNATAGDSQATVNFTPPASDGGSPITSYTVTSTPDGITAAGTASPITVTGLTNGTAYTFTVTAVNAIGTGPASGPSNIVTPAVPAVPTLGTPTSVVALAGDGQAIVGFTPPASDSGNPISSYTVTSTPDGITATGSSSPITVSGLTNGTAYTFTVAAVFVNGKGPESSPSNSVTPAPAGSSIVTPAAGFSLCTPAGIILTCGILAFMLLLTASTTKAGLNNIKK